MRDVMITGFWVLVGLVTAAVLVAAPMALAAWVVRSVWRSGGR